MRSRKVGPAVGACKGRAPGRRRDTSGGQQAGLDLVERGAHALRQPVEGERCLAASAPRGHHLPRRHVARPHLETQRHASRLPFEVLRAGLHAVAQVRLDPQRGGSQLGLQSPGDLRHGGALFVRHEADVGLLELVRTETTVGVAEVRELEVQLEWPRRHGVERSAERIQMPDSGIDPLEGGGANLRQQNDCAVHGGLCRGQWVV